VVLSGLWLRGLPVQSRLVAQRILQLAATAIDREGHCRGPVEVWARVTRVQDLVLPPNRWYQGRETDKLLNDVSLQRISDHLSDSLDFAIRDRLMVVNPLKPGPDKLRLVFVRALPPGGWARRSRCTTVWSPKC
jgi:hypothetical protein